MVMSKRLRHAVNISLDELQWSKAVLEVIRNRHPSEEHIVIASNLASFTALMRQLELNPDLSYKFEDSLRVAFPVVEFKIKRK